MQIQHVIHMFALSAQRKEDFMAASHQEYRKRFGDRNDGRLVRSLSPFDKFIPFIMPSRNDGTNFYEESFEVSSVEKRLKALRNEGYKGIGFLHFMIAAYIRCISLLPGINRFVSGRRVFARNNIEVVMAVKRDLSLNAPETTIKVEFTPSDTIFDVYRKLNEKIEEIKSGTENNNTEDVAEALCKLPRFLLRFGISILRALDYFGWLPKSLLDASPFHGSMIITDLGSLRIGPIYHHIYNFGNLPVFIAFGAKYKKYEYDKNGNLCERKYVDTKFALDERIADGHYYSQFLQALRALFQHPEIVETPPSKVVEDIF